MTWTVGCASAASPRLTEGSPIGGAVVLQVTNRSLSDMQLHLVRGGTAIRLGMVPSLSTRTLGITSAQLGSGGELHLEARTRSDPDPRRSPVFMAVSGQRIAWVINVHRATDMVVIR